MLQRTKRDLILTIIFAGLAALAIFMISFRDLFDDDGKSVVSSLIALCFWFSLALQQFFFWKADKGRKMIQKRTFKGKNLVKPTPGIITFFSSREATVCDITLAVALILTVMLIFQDAQTNALSIGVLAILVLSFSLHCVLNGTTYRYIKAFYKLKKERENSGNARTAN